MMSPPRQPERQASTYSACQHVFNITELLEAILCQLDIHTLLLSPQRVNTHWYSTITHSRLLQRHLFFLPDTEDINGKEEKRQNTLLTKAFLPWFSHRVGGNRGGWGRYAFARLSPDKTPGLWDAIMRPGASWRRMLPTQPPPVKLGVWLDKRYDGSFRDTAHFKILRFPRGLRMGALYDLTAQPMSTTIWAEFAVYWRSGNLNVGNGSWGCILNLERIRSLSRCAEMVDAMLRVEGRWPCRAGEEIEDKEFVKSWKYREDGYAALLHLRIDSGFRPVAEWISELDTDSAHIR